MQFPNTFPKCRSALFSASVVPSFFAFSNAADFPFWFSVDPYPMSSWNVPSRRVTRTMTDRPTLTRCVWGFSSTKSIWMFWILDDQPLNPKTSLARAMHFSAVM